jgi:hypothetical protein
MPSSTSSKHGQPACPGGSEVVGIEFSGVGSVQDIAGGTAPRFCLFPQVKHAAQSFIMRDYLD